MTALGRVVILQLGSIFAVKARSPPSFLVQLFLAAVEGARPEGTSMYNVLMMQSLHDSSPSWIGLTSRLFPVLRTQLCLVVCSDPIHILASDCYVWFCSQQAKVALAWPVGSILHRA